MKSSSTLGKAATRNRRTQVRHTLVRRSGVLHCPDWTEPCTILNISDGGLMARTYRPRLPGERVRIELADGEMIDGTVLWAKDWTIGVAFDSPLDVEGLLARPWVAEDSDERRRLPRIAVRCPATLRVIERFYRGRIRDISCVGACFEGRAPLKKPGPALLSLPDLPPLTGTVAWTKGAACGLVFDVPIPGDALSRWLASRNGTPE